ncbi:glycosyltransferase family 8 protein [Pectinatus frisingensis]|uniref:glycosyltransferase family 8 protein n=1 Tax=Pectinatus frisingensis TaxID=865 RepID=UPI0018C6C436|nr:glycosyltransferase family 8 protein [Pectinatus frisingensis]
MVNNEIIHIALGVDDKYFAYAGILMTSILLNSFDNEIIFHVAVNGTLSDENINRKNKFNNIYKKAQIKIYDLSQQIKDLPNLSAYTDKRFNKSILLRIFIPKILPDTIKRVIYLDADMLCIDNINFLWKLNIPYEYIIAACPYKEKNGQKQIKRLGLQTDKYFNSGMMMINLLAWKKYNITEIISDCYKKFYEFFLLPDQDAINVVLQNKINTISYKFNRMIAANDPTLDLREKGDILLHFVNDSKPWIKGNTPEMERLYKYYVAKSLWSDIKFIEPETLEMMLLAGRNYEEKRDFERAAYYYGNTAKKLMIEHLKYKYE